ncbi:inter-alpha-trypsin inhibitor-like [Anticarsia gemmatalis]|uniref:inter-alpha-trypsin inhibitor-like n=1 Tax=Anticarsia gemmatalis TaxID=129554 RepID=UPI003F760095
MITVTPWFLQFYILYLQIVIGVRIFENTLDIPAPTRNPYFEPKVISKTCLLKPKRGPCRAGIEMYYYNADTKNCSTFLWGGCQGNGNRFDSKALCEEGCLSKRGDKRTRPKWCTLAFDYGFCFGAVKRYYFDRVWKVCKKTIYSGCGGNRNNFYEKAQCESMCLYSNGSLSFGKKERTGPRKVIIINPGPTAERTNATEPTTLDCNNRTTTKKS